MSNDYAPITQQALNAAAHNAQLAHSNPGIGSLLGHIKATQHRLKQLQAPKGMIDSACTAREIVVSGVTPVTHNMESFNLVNAQEPIRGPNAQRVKPGMQPRLS